MSVRASDVLARATAMAFGPEARVAETVDLVGDASSRLYQRVTLAGARVPTAVAMRFAPDVTKSDEASAGPAPTELPFLNVQRAARTRGVQVPEVYADLSREGLVLLEDLGDDTLFRVLQRVPRDAWWALYDAAIAGLCIWQKAFTLAEPDEGCLAYGRSFERGLVRWELDHYREWGVEALAGPLAPPLRAALDAEFDRLADAVSALPRVMVHRDWQSKNLMVRDNGAIVVIDFQDALVGPRPYDLVALLCDSYVSLTSAEQDLLLSRYLALAGVPIAEHDVFRRQFHAQAVQRKLKDAGRFVYIDRVKHNPSFLQYRPQSLRYVRRSLRALGDEWSKLRALLAEADPVGFALDAPA